MVEKRVKNSGKAPPPFRAMPERNRFFLCDVFPKEEQSITLEIASNRLKYRQKSVKHKKIEKKIDESME